ncbi:MAG: allophanate hydrolase [Gammaproteobacteria bacterium]|nr:allophanate hydrolase [Gammaproteobacteria bacterium]
MNVMRHLQGLSLDFNSLNKAYRANTLTPIDVVREVYGRIHDRGTDFVWTCLVPESQALAAAQALARHDPAQMPLYGLPFAVKDNIHVLGLKTTAGCPAYGHYPAKTATVVQKLLDAGAILIGKNSMDQFATGLVGIRSAGYPVNSFDSEYIPGGSSSGSAVAVATGLVSFSLGSDTGGSGRIPAALNNIVGLKPTPGIISTAGMVYANRSFDCVPIFALTCRDAKQVFDVAVGADSDDPFMRENPNYSARSEIPASGFIIGIPDKANRTFFGDQRAEKSFHHAIHLIKDLGGEIVEIDFCAFATIGSMLFDGPILAERLVSCGEFIENHRHDVHPVVGAIVNKAKSYSAVDLVKEYHRFRQLMSTAYAELRKVDALIVPTAGTIYKIKTVEADPIKLNANMGYYSYFANLLQLAALAVPAALRDDGLPFGICFLAGPQQDLALVALGERFQTAARLPLGATRIRYAEH